MDKFLIVTNRDKDKDLKITRDIQEYLESKGKDCHLAVPLEGNDLLETGFTDVTQLQEDVECVIVLGGDGTFIQTVRDFAGLDIPIVGVNLGTVGFLAAIDVESLYEGLDALIDGKYTVQHRILLGGEVYRNGRRLQKSIAFNDIVVACAGFSRLVELKIYVNNQLLDIYAADGVIVSTPTGSTGYNLSAGGPVVFPETQMMIITPICPHSLSARSVVVPSNAKIRIEVGRRRKTQKEEALITYDGQLVRELESGDIVEVVQAAVQAPIINIRQKNFCDILRDKMKNG
ncbi:MAG: NAD(+)/NADH kinase [Clostridia bacterium]|nr:NAD(+)/NADH kinase [Lachnospiraceae bacterium]NCC00257.1 NAD(+)/NADH kinase [Clostridia bacterium]NCD02281.1 NAD(+)/NADH kinase [Clostridia bacterium]